LVAQKVKHQAFKFDFTADLTRMSFSWRLILPTMCTVSSK